MVFIFPWATVFGSHEIIKIDARWGWFSLTEMFLFMGILILGLVYVWVKGDLDWIKAKPVMPTVDTKIPKSLYDKVNLEQSAYQVKAFAMEMAQPKEAATIATAEPATLRKPMFKATFKKTTDES